MRIFDNVLLGQYLDAGAKVKVFTNSEWYDLADTSDVSDKVDAVGYDQWGGAHRFSYQTIEQIQVNGKTITIDMMSQKMGDQPSDDEGSGDSKKGSSDDGGGGDEPPEELKDKPEKSPDLSWFSPAYDIGRKIIEEKERKKSWK